MMGRLTALLTLCGVGLWAATSIASSSNITIEIVTMDDGTPVGTMSFRDTEYGLLVKPDLADLTPGIHAVHIHENPDCSDAGDHFDPANTGKHEGPYGEGHLGDLPNIIVEPDGKASIEVLAPRLSSEAILGRAVIIHSGADRYDLHSSHVHGKGGARMYCGVIL